MFDSVLLDVAIGVALVFFLIASLVAALNEWVTRLLDIRAKVLWNGLANALDPDKGEPFSIGFFDSFRWFYGPRDLRPIVAAPDRTTWQRALTAVFGVMALVLGRVEAVWRRLPLVSEAAPSGPPGELVIALAATPVVRSLGGVTTIGTPGRTRVDHIASSTFAAAVVDAAVHTGRTDAVAHIVEARRALARAGRADASATVVVDGWRLAADRGKLASALAEAGLDADLADPVAGAAMAWQAAAESGDEPRLVAAARQAVPGLAQGVDAISIALDAHVLARLGYLTAGSPLGEVVQRVARRADATIDDLTRAVGDWYDDYMDRLSDLYRLAARKILFVAGLALAVGLNVGAIDLVRDLRNNSEARTALALAAADACAGDTDLVDCRDDVSVELGEADDGLTLPLVGDYMPPWDSLTGPEGEDTLDWWWVVAGWLLTGLAVSFGAPFWFDIVQRLTSYQGGSSSSD